MPTLGVTFAFLSDAQSFASTPGANVTMAWDGSVGNPAGSLSSALTGRNHHGVTSFWQRTLTFETMGVPAGSTITGITSASLQSRCTVYTTGIGFTSGATTLTDGATVITLSNTRAGTATDASFQTETGTDATGLSLASSDSVAIRINNLLDTGNSSSANVTLKQDQLAFTITYTLPTINAVLTKTDANDTVSAAGAVLTHAALSKTEANDTVSAISTVLVSAALSKTEDSDTITAAGTTGGNINAALTQIEDSDTVSAAATNLITGTLSKTEANDTIAAAGTVLLQAILNTIESGDIVLATGVVGAAPATATLNIIEANDTVLTSATVAVIASLSKTEAGDSISATGTTGGVGPTVHDEWIIRARRLGKR